MGVVKVGDARNLPIPDESVDLIVTSPPYNLGIPYEGYDDNLSLEEWERLIEDFSKEAWRVLVPHGRIAINVAGINRNPYIGLHHKVGKVFVDNGWFFRGEIIWRKIGAPYSTAWGSWLSPADPYLWDEHEYILVFSKGRGSKLPRIKDAKPDITKEEFLAFRKSIWEILPETRNVGHPVPFPQEIPYRLIKLYTWPGDAVLDPFCGSGTTCVVAKKLKRDYYCFDISRKYVEVAKKRISSVLF